MFPIASYMTQLLMHPVGVSFCGQKTTSSTKWRTEQFLFNLLPPTSTQRKAWRQITNFSLAAVSVVSQPERPKNHIFFFSCMPNFIVVLEKWQFDKSRKINENESELLNFVCFAISTVHLWVETAHMSMTHLANYALGSPLHHVTYKKCCHSAPDSF